MEQFLLFPNAFPLQLHCVDIQVQAKNARCFDICRHFGEVIAKSSADAIQTTFTKKNEKDHWVPKTAGC